MVAYFCDSPLAGRGSHFVVVIENVVTWFVVLPLNELCIVRIKSNKKWLAEGYGWILLMRSRSKSVSNRR